MYKYQIKRLLKKHFPLLLIIVIIAAAGKVLALRISDQDDELSKESQQLLDSYVQQTIDYSTEERFSFVTEKSRSDADKIASIESPKQEQIDEYKLRSDVQNTYHNSLVKNAYTLLGVQKYIKTGEGLVDTAIPENFNETKKVYLNIKEPKVVNELHFKHFIALQSYSLVPVFVLLLVGLLIADSFEKRIDLQAKISKNSKLFFRSQEITLSIFICILLIANTICDMAISGLISHPYELSAPIQSINDYVFLPQNLTLLQTIFLLFLLQTAGAFICYHVFVVAAQKMRSAKGYMIFALSFIVLTTLVSKFFPATAIYTFTGITDKKSVLNGIVYLPSLDSNNIFIIAIICILLLCGLTVWRYMRYSKNTK